MHSLTTHRTPPASRAASQGSANQPAPPPPGTTTIQEVTSPAAPGAAVTVAALAQPGATCSLTAGDADAHPVATGTQPATADAQGQARWTWHLDAALAAGSYRLVVTCSPGTSATSTLIVR